MTTAVRTSRSGEAVGMGANVARLPTAFHNPKAVPVEVRLADRWGRAPDTWHRRIYGDGSAFADGEKIVEALVAGGEGERAYLLVSRLQERLLPTPPAVAAALDAHDEADTGEDGIRIVLRRELREHGVVSHATRELAIRKLGAELHRGEILLAALHADQRQHAEV